MSSHYPVIIVGAGQAGLSQSYLLQQAGIEHVVLEKHRLGHTWRSERWDSFCLVTPNWQCRLPGHSYTGSDPHGFMLRAEIVQYLEGYARAFGPPIREGVEVLSLKREDVRGARPVSRFTLETTAGSMSADQVVVATGGYHDPRVPSFAARIPDSILQLHSRDYKNPEVLPDGDVLVVGTGQSGCQIAEDVFLASQRDEGAGRGAPRRVHLSVGTAPRCARRHRGKDVVEWLEQMGHYELPIDRFPNKEQVRDKTNHYVTGRDGGHDIDLRQFALLGMQLYGSLTGLEGTQLSFAPDLGPNLDAADNVYRGINQAIDKYVAERGISAPPGIEYVAPWEPTDEPRALDLASTQIGTIIWSIGFGVNFGWIQLPAFDERGHPRHERGVSSVPGLYFLGLPWQYTWGSGRFCGVGRDAEFLAEIIVEQASQDGMRSIPARASSFG